MLCCAVRLHPVRYSWVISSLSVCHVLFPQMETTIKHAEEERMKALENARHLFEEHQLLKEQINGMRANIGLDQMPDSLCGGETSNIMVHK
jgi:Zinc finger-containing protein